jgi:hypothetical protein
VSKNDFVWKVISRYDQYIVSTNNKAAIVIAYSAIIVGSIIVKYQDVQAMFNGYPGFLKLTDGMLTIAALSSLAVLWVTFKVVLPSMKSPKKGNSAIFYGDVADHATGEKYIEQVQAMTDKQEISDLSVQAHALAGIAKSKFSGIWWAMVLILYVQLPAIAVIVCTRLALILQ